MCTLQMALKEMWIRCTLVLLGGTFATMIVSLYFWNCSSDTIFYN